METTIKLSSETRDLLKSIGRKGETYESILKRLIHKETKEG